LKIVHKLKKTRGFHFTLHIFPLLTINLNVTFILSNPSNSNQLKTNFFINEINDKESYVVLSKSPNYDLEMILINYPQPNKKILKWKFYGVWN
jgi:hypothetical protein